MIEMEQIKFNAKNCTCNQKKIEKCSAIKAQQTSKTLVHSATFTMFQNIKTKAQPNFRNYRGCALCF